MSRIIIKQYMLWWTLIMITWFLAVCSSHHNIVMLLIILMIMCYREIKRKSLVIPKVLLMSIMFQNTIIGIGFRIYQNYENNTGILTQIPFFIIVFASFFILSKEFFKKEHLIFFIYLLIIAFYCYKGGVRNLIIILYNIRNLIAFYLVYCIGKRCIDTREKFLEMKRFYVNLSIIAVLFGFVIFAIGKEAYIAMGIEELYHVKTLGDETMIWNNGLPGNFTGEFMGYWMIRMGSFFLEPVNLSSFLALAVIFAVCDNSLWRIVILLSGNVLTFGKGGLMIAGLSIGIIILGNCVLKIKGIGVKNTSFLLRSTPILIGAVLGIAYGTAFTYNIHFFSIINTFGVLKSNPWGMGVGTVGNASNMIGAVNSLVGAETGLLNFWCQIGIFGLGVFITILLIMSSNVIKGWKEDDLKNYKIVFIGLPIILILVFLFQENTFTVQVISGYMLFLGYFGNRVERKEYEKN